jgi:hypothetical protein
VCARCCQVLQPQLHVEHHLSLHLNVGVGRAARAYDHSEWHVQQRLSPLQQLITAPGLGPRLVHHLEPEPRKQQDWILMCLQGGRAHLLTACGVATLCCCSPKVRVGVGVRVRVRAQGD